MIRLDFLRKPHTHHPFITLFKYHEDGTSSFKHDALTPEKHRREKLSFHHTVLKSGKDETSPSSHNRFFIVHP